MVYHGKTKKIKLFQQSPKRKKNRNTETPKKKPVKIEIKLIGNFVFSASIGKI